LEDEEESRTIVSMQHSGQLKPPDCEAALADAIGFVCAMAVRPRATVRYLDNRALVFIREGRSDSQTGLPRPIAYHGARDQNFWNLFLAFLRHCTGKNAFEGTPLGKLFSELVYASTGTIHGLVLSLAVAVDDLVGQIVGRQPRNPRIDELKAHIVEWTGDKELKESAIRLVMSILSRPSTQQHLTSLAKKGVVTPEQVAIWKQLRPKVAHGKVAEYNEDLWQKRNELIGMVYRLAARVLCYKGPLTDHTQSPPTEYSFDWAN
jgi:DNA-binding transcriptional ArsR family regulator